MEFYPDQAAAHFVELAEQVKQRYEHNQFMIEHYDKELTDLNHVIELTTFSAKEGGQMVRQVKTNRRKRRICKDENIVLRPLYEYLIKGERNQIINDLRAVKRATDKEKAYVANQQYNPRTSSVSAEVFKKNR